MTELESRRSGLRHGVALGNGADIEVRPAEPAEVVISDGTSAIVLTVEQAMNLYAALRLLDGEGLLGENHASR